MADAIVLIGMPGAGKSTVGAALARLLGWGFVDIDDVVANDVGDVPAFIERAGIDAFRESEIDAIEVVTDAIRSGGAPDSVVGVGGGAVLAIQNRERLTATGRIVWLRATLPTLLGRVADGAGRPLLAGGAETALAQLVEERTPIYAALASVVVDVDGLDSNEAAVAIVKELSAA